MEKITKEEFEMHGLATDAENIRFAAEAADNMALMAVEYENRHGNMDLLEEFGYFDAMQRLTSYVCRDMRELQDALYAAAHAMREDG